MFITSLKTKGSSGFYEIHKRVPLKKLLIMNDRSHNLLQIRPLIISAKVDPSMSFDEQFQNRTLRPIIKLQSQLLAVAFQNYITKHKNKYYELSLENQLNYIENAIQKDIKFRNSLKGMIIGQFTVEEYGIYIGNSSALNKRMMNMVIERLKNQIQIFEPQPLVQQ
jgi:hypothetical protein